MQYTCSAAHFDSEIFRQKMRKRRKESASVRITNAFLRKVVKVWEQELRDLLLFPRGEPSIRMGFQLAWFCLCHRQRNDLRESQICPSRKSTYRWPTDEFRRRDTGLRRACQQAIRSVP